MVLSGRYCVGQDSTGCSANIGPSNYSTPAYWHGSGFVWSLNVDTDLDNVSDIDDNCPLTPNTNQDDMDGDNVGDVAGMNYCIGQRIQPIYVSHAPLQVAASGCGVRGFRIEVGIGNLDDT